jgi:signal transduction histidine kinase
MPFPVALDLPLQRLPPGLEASVYFFVSEALTNVVKHAGASRAAIRIGLEAERLTIEVVDNGVGGAEATNGGYGLTGLADRVAAFGGELTVNSPTGRGTTVRAEIQPGQA